MGKPVGVSEGAGLGAGESVGASPSKILGTSAYDDLDKSRSKADRISVFLIVLLYFLCLV